MASDGLRVPLQQARPAHLPRAVASCAGHRWVCDNWKRRTRASGGPRGKAGFVYSSSWLGRGRPPLRSRTSALPADRTRWLKVRDTIYEQIMKRGVSRKPQGLRPSYGAGPGRSALIDAARDVRSPPIRDAVDARSHKPLGGGGRARRNASSNRYDVRTRRRLRRRGHVQPSAPSGWWSARRSAGRTRPENRAEAAWSSSRCSATRTLGLYAEETGQRRAIATSRRPSPTWGLISAAVNPRRALGQPARDLGPAAKPE